MSDKFKELVKRLRSFGVTTRGIMVGDVHDAADALEALAGEVERLTTNGIHTCHDQCQRRACVQGREIRALTAERDRLKAALERVRQFTKGGPDHVSDDDITEIFKAADAALGDAS